MDNEAIEVLREILNELRVLRSYIVPMMNDRRPEWTTAVRRTDDEIAQAIGQRNIADYARFELEAKLDSRRGTLDTLRAVSPQDETWTLSSLAHVVAEQVMLGDFKAPSS